jgi:putative hemolysin
MNTKKLHRLMSIVLVTLLLAGCGGVSPEPTATLIQPPQPPTSTEVVESTPVPAITQQATVIELPDGTRCSFAGTGATLAFEGKRLNYTCEVEGQEVGLLGDVQQSEGVWKVEKVVIGHGDSGFFVQESEEVTMTIERIELADGTQCLFAGTGATLAFEGKRLNYTCQVEGQEVGLLGDLRQSEGIWTVEKAVLGHDDSGFFVQELEEVTIKVISASAASAGMPNPASAFCEEQGGRVEIREGEGGQVGYCVFPDGSECEEWAFFRGECAPGGGEYQPPDSAVCGDLSKTMVQTLGAAVTTEEAPFVDYISGKAGTGCQMRATGTGLDFENFWSVAETLRETLGSQGWEADFMYAADGPTGTGNGFRRGNTLCLFSVGWEPSEDANCPQDQPISACELRPEQKLYTIRLNCAQDTTVATVPQPEPEPRRIQFAPGATSAQVQGSLAAGGGDRYVLTAMAGQVMTVNLSVATAEVSAILIIWGADGTVLISDHADATTWKGVLPSTQDYYINVRSVAQAPVDYTLEVIIPPVASPTEPEPRRIQFAPGTTSAQVQGSLAVGGGDRYVLTAMAGQEMTVNLFVPTAEVSAILIIWGADGTVLISDHADATTWVGQLPSTQDYYINVRSVAQAPVGYTLEVIIPPVASQPEPEPRRIQFAPGTISAQVQGSLAAGGGDRYVLTAMAGQEMTVNLSVATAEVSAILVIWGADGTVLISDHADATTWKGVLPLTQDYYINVRSVVQAPVDYTLEVIIPPK